MNIVSGPQEGATGAARFPSGEPVRRFTVRDGMFLIVASAIGFFMAGSLFHNRRPGANPLDYKHAIFLFGLGMTAYTPAFLVLGLIRPRPAIRQPCRQTGFTALAVGTVMMSLGLLVLPPISLVRSINPKSFSSGFRDWNPALSWWANVIIPWASQVGPAVVAAWVLLALSGRRRPGRGWLGWTGKTIGVGWIAFFLLIRFIQLWEILTH